MLLLQRCEASWAWNEGGGKGVRKRFPRIVFVDEMLLVLMPMRGTIVAVFIVRRTHEGYYAKGKSSMCVLWT